MSISADSRCLLCQLERYSAQARGLGTASQATAFTKALMALYASAPEGVSAPWFSPAVTRLFSEHFGLEADRFRQEKADSNAFALAWLPRVEAMVSAAPDPVLAGLQCAILGNYIDFSALHGEVSFDTLEGMLSQALEMELDGAAYAAFCRDLQAGERLLYLTDNAGEIGFDRVCAQAIHRKYPHLAITFCVRGGPASNDATREDAAAVGIPFPVIDNGTSIPGTVLEAISREAGEAIAQADVILAKGQGNAETLLGCGYNIYYAFLVKCQLFMEKFQKPKLTPMLLSERGT